MLEYTAEEYEELHLTTERLRVTSALGTIIDDHIWRQAAFGHTGNDLTNAIKELEMKAEELKRAQDVLYIIPLLDVPRYINDPNEQIQAIAKWRLKIGK